MEELHEELQSWVDNMPENLKSSSKADEINTAIEELDTAINALEEAESVSPSFPGMF